MANLAASFKIGNRNVGDGASCFIIAEAGVSHFGEFEKALRLVDLAADAGADAVKFQIFDIDEMIAGVSHEWRERLGSRMLPYNDFSRIRDYAHERGIIFFATAHDEKSFEFLASLDPLLFKIGSGELQNWDFVRSIADRGKPIVFSTGMYEMSQVEAAVAAMLETGNDRIAVLQCTTSYPTHPSSVNLRVMNTYRDVFGGVIGYSDHTAGYHIPLAAVARGAQVIEKHISLDFNVPNAQDWKVSCGPHDLAKFVSAVRDIEASLGNGSKEINSEEKGSVDWARKSLVLARALKAGEVVDRDALVAKRPGTGIAPDQIDNVVGKRINADLRRDTVLTWEHLV